MAVWLIRLRSRVARAWKRIGSCCCLSLLFTPPPHPSSAFSAQGIFSGLYPNTSSSGQTVEVDLWTMDTVSWRAPRCGTSGQHFLLCNTNLNPTPPHTHPPSPVTTTQTYDSILDSAAICPLLNNYTSEIMVRPLFWGGPGCCGLLSHPLIFSPFCLLPPQPNRLEHFDLEGLRQRCSQVRCVFCGRPSQPRGCLCCLGLACELSHD